ncbi:MAG TPA: serine hydrolase [Candidatus Paceibacterota bacterium]
MKSTFRIIVCLVVFSLVATLVATTLGARGDNSIKLQPKERFAVLFDGLFGTQETKQEQEEGNKPSFLEGLLVNKSSAYDEEIEVSSTYSLKDKNIKLPVVNAQSFLVADLKTGDLILARRPNYKSPIASVTKLMTALVALENMKSDSEMIVDKESLNTEGQVAGFSLDEKITVGEAIYPLLLVSSNDAAELLARSYGRPNFMVLMNERARHIGMQNTHFEDPSGLSYKTVSTAYDLFKLVQYLEENMSYEIDITKMKMRKSVDASRSHIWHNNNPFAKRDYDYYNGGKQGYTEEATHTVVSVFNLPISESGSRDIVIVLLKSRDIQKDTKSITKYLIDNVRFN